MCAVLPSRSRTSASQWRGGAAGAGGCSGAPAVTSPNLVGRARRVCARDAAADSRPHGEQAQREVRWAGQWKIESRSRTEVSVSAGWRSLPSGLTAYTLRRPTLVLVT